VGLPTEELVREIYANSYTIAVVGASSDPQKEAHSIPAYLADIGYRVIAVNPRGGELFGQKVRASLADIDEPVDVVNVFRPSEETPEIAREAAAIGAKVLWLQVGIHSDEAESIAEEAGMTFLSDMCIRATHRMLGLGRAPQRP
jgi:predicted CoA-binding protein